MNVEEIMQNRAGVAYRLLRNLREYGNFAPPDFYGLPAYGSTFSDKMSHMGKSNYLRVMASLTPQSKHNPILVHYDEIRATGNSLPEQAKPIYLEQWSEDAASFSVILVPYYNVEDIVLTNDPEKKFAALIAKGQELAQPVTQAESAFQADGAAVYADYQEGLIHSMQEAMPAIREAVLNHADEFPDLTEKISFKTLAKDESLDALAIRFYAQLVYQKSCLPQPWNKENPLLDDAALQELEHDPKRLFQAINAAQDMLKYHNMIMELSAKLNLTSASAQQEAEEPAQFGQEKAPSTPEPSKETEPEPAPAPVSTDDASKPEPETVAKVEDDYNGPFKGLVVTCHYVDDRIPDPDTGEPMKDQTTYVGEAAYKYLMMLNARDKIRFDNCGRNEGGDGKTDIAVRYGDFVYNNGEFFPSDLGSLQFGNRTSVTEMLKYRLTLISRNAFDPNLTDIYLTGERKDMTVKELHDEAWKEVHTVSDALKPLAEEEKAYLEKHPEYKTINGRKATPYTYMVSKDMVQQNPTLGDFGELSRENVKDYCAFPVGLTDKIFHELTLPEKWQDTSSMNPAREDSPYLVARDMIPDNMVAIYSPRRPKSVTHNALMVMPHNNIEAVKALRKLSVKYHVTCDSWTEENEVSGEDYSGLAMNRLARIVSNDDSAFRSAVKDKFFSYKNKEVWDIALCYDGTELTKAKATIGEGKFAKLFRGEDFLHIQGKILEADAVYKAIHALTWYQDRFDWANLSNEKQSLPQREVPNDEESWKTCLAELQSCHKEIAPTYSAYSETPPVYAEEACDLCRKFGELDCLNSDTDNQIFKAGTSALLAAGFTTEEAQSLGKALQAHGMDNKYRNAGTIISRSATMPDVIEQAKALRSRCLTL